ncbi:MAG: hypothetical protein GY778_25545, partial [bacterium]|nr:hypothetical protein [bacterium]
LTVIYDDGLFFDGLGISPVTGNIYGSRGGDDDIYLLDPVTGAASFVGDPGLGSLSDLDFAPGGVVGVTGRGLGNNLASIDLDESDPNNPFLGGGSALVGSTGVPDGATGIAVDSGGRIFASTTTSRDPTVSYLMEVDEGTGQGTVIAPIVDSVTGAHLMIGDLAVQPGTDVLFGVRGGANLFSQDDPTTLLYSIDTATGIATEIGEIVDGAENRSFSGGLAFAANGTLYHNGTFRGFDHDTLANIENVTGSEGADTIIGDGLGNVITGRGGNDQITGGGGDDTIDGGQGGTDRIFYAGNASDFTISTDGFGVTTIVDNNLADGDLGTDSLENAE